METLNPANETKRTSLPQFAWDVGQETRPPERTRILLVHDSSRDFGYELADLRKAGFSSAVEIELLTVADLLLPPLYFTVGDTPDLAYYYEGELHKNYSSTHYYNLAERLGHASLEAAQSLKTAFPFWTVSKSISTEYAARAVIEKAAQWKPDLVVIGSADLSWFERKKLRSLTRRLVSEARCSVRVTRSSSNNADAPNRLMIGFDGSRHAEAALAAVRRRAWGVGSEVFLISCVEPLITDELDWAHDYVEIDRRRAAEQLSSAKRDLEQVGLTVHMLAPVGNPSQTILDEARKHKIEAIFLGTRELGAIENLLSGSVSATVAAKADCSVEIARAAKEPHPHATEQRLAA